MFDRCLYFNINTLARLVNKKWAEAFEPYDLSPAHGYMLRVVLTKPGITQKELAVELGLEKSTITRFVDVLQRKEMLVRKSGGTDGREQNIHPTRKGKAIQKPLEDLGDNLYQTMVSTFGEEPLINLVKQLRESAEIMK